MNVLRQLNELINFDTFENETYVLATKFYPYENEMVKGLLLFYQYEPSYGEQYYVVSIHGYSKSNYSFRIDKYDKIEKISEKGIIFNSY